MKFPSHKAGLYLEHNSHKDAYETVKNWVHDSTHAPYAPDCFVSPEDMQKCIDTDDCWSLQWYPDTPIGFYKVCGSSLEIVLERAMEIDAEMQKKGAAWAGYMSKAADEFDWDGLDKEKNT